MGKEQAILVGVTLPCRSPQGVTDTLDELALLACTAGAEVLDRVVQMKKAVDPAFFIGRGKAEEIGTKAERVGANLTIFDDDLSPAQMRNLEQVVGTKIVDRSGLILDIFAKRAKTREAKVQVELAQLEYLLPRLTRQWTHLSRQAGGGGTVMGGIGTRGPGETQLEVDRRKTRKRIADLTKALSEIGRRRSLERKGRKEMFRCALVGYTNAGKSTLMNLLAGTSVFVEDRLFATLDPTTRLVSLGKGSTMLLTDTVGFIRKLPHHLVASFRTTLEEAVEADLLLHVADASHPGCREQILTANDVLAGLGIAGKPTVMVFNKIDRVENRSEMTDLLIDYPEAITVSATTGEGIDDLTQRMLQHLQKNRVVSIFSVPSNDGKTLSRLYECGEVLERWTVGDTIVLKVLSNVWKEGADVQVHSEGGEVF
ncbi:MAG: GTPase HflX [Candidatus Latescibacteria bacterium]|nr:GTPase HflX [Candidatus Latescibacterota bacterium]